MPPKDADGNIRMQGLNPPWRLTVQQPDDVRPERFSATVPSEQVSAREPAICCCTEYFNLRFSNFFSKVEKTA
jgi:hypothetical protein